MLLLCPISKFEVVWIPAALLSEGFSIGKVLRRRRVLVFGPTEQGDECIQVFGRIPQRSIILEWKLEETLSDEENLLCLGQDPEVGGQAQPTYEAALALLIEALVSDEGVSAFM